MFASEVRRQRLSCMRGLRQWRWHVNEVYVKIDGEMHYLAGSGLRGRDSRKFVTQTRDKLAALIFVEKALKRHGSSKAIATYGLATKHILIRLTEPRPAPANAHRSAIVREWVLERYAGIFLGFAVYFLIPLSSVRAR
jgi:transposase-like protein